MNLIVNGESREVASQISLHELLASLGLDKKACAAEVNERLIPRADHAGYRLASDDRVEIVTLVGGG